MNGTPTLLGLPYDGSSSYKRGAAAAPDMIRAALRSPAANPWTEALVDISRSETLGDAGNLDLEDGGQAREAIESRIRELLSDGRRPISLGGDHSVTYPIIRALGPAHDKLCLLQIDAHPDLYTEFDGDRYSHACPFTRILEESLIGRLVQVGIRTMAAEQQQNARKFGVESIDMRAWSAGVRPKIDGPVYISIDVDGLDPAFAPGVSHREPGGLSVREVVTLIQGIDQPIVGADVVEFNPREDPVGLTAPVCAKLVKELASRMIEARQTHAT